MNRPIRRQSAQPSPARAALRAAVTSPPRCICHWQRFGGLARAGTRCSGSFIFSVQKRTVFTVPFCTEKEGFEFGSRIARPNTGL